MSIQIRIIAVLLLAFALQAVSAPLSVERTSRYWLFFAPDERSEKQFDEAAAEVASSLTARSLARRRKVIHSEPPVRPCDIPPSPARLQAVRDCGCEIVRVTRYLNAVTVQGSPQALEKAKLLPFVTSSRHVFRFREELYDDCPDLPKCELPATDDAEDYGDAWNQSTIVNLPAAHNLGYKGRGVFVGVQDSGFDNLRHRCFSNLDLIATWDFLNNDPNVGDEHDMGSGAHGTRTLSVIAGLDSGRFIGTAPGASYILTKTENTEWERQIEEDTWAAGLWFHDSLGTEVLSSSVSYRDWYEYEDMDGETAVTTRAAEAAVEAGMVIVNSGGNTGRDAYPFSKIGAPADARGVLAAGAVLADSSYWTASSQGPTFDGRIKPDVAALGVGVFTAVSFNDLSYFPRNGTSFSCPMIAGVAALVLEANSDLTPAQVREILWETSSRSGNPDTLVGYGIINALAAVLRAESMAVPTRPVLPDRFSLNAFPNPFNSRLTIIFNGASCPEKLVLYDLQGRMQFSMPVSMHPGEHGRISLDLHHLPAGGYILRAEERGEIVSRRVIHSR